MGLRSEDLYLALDSVCDFDFSKNKFWWPEYGSFWVIIGTILTQNTKWSAVSKSLENLKNYGVNSLKDLADIKEDTLANLIKPSGFYNTKAKRLSSLIKAIIARFDSFDVFRSTVTAKWLMAQKGLGLESVYSILCYACGRGVMVVDGYTLRIFNFLGYEFDDYEEARAWLESIDRGVVNLDDSELFARYHGIIVEFGKKFSKGKEFSQEGKSILQDLLDK